MVDKKFLEGSTGLLFSLSLTLILLFYVMFHVTTYDSIQPIVNDVLSKQDMPKNFDESDFKNTKEDYISRCSNSTSGTIAVELENDKSVEVDCGSIKSTNNSKELISLVGMSMFKENYYKDYGCDFVQCLLSEKSSTDKLTMILSEKAHVFFGGVQVYLAIATILLGLVFAYFSGTPAKIARNFGWIFLFLGSSVILSEICKRVHVVKNVDSVFALMSTASSGDLNSYLIASFVIGAVLLISSYGWSYYKER
jgi:hypothetical protein